MRKPALLLPVAMLLSATPRLQAHDAHGRSNAPPEALRLKSPFNTSEAQHREADKALYTATCSGCHGDDGKSRTRLAGSLPLRPTDLSHYLMESMRDGEIYWVVTRGIETRMPAFGDQLNETQRWEIVSWVRELRERQKVVEVANLGPYSWNLPPGFPYPNVPPDNPMTQAKVDLGRHLFYDKRLSLNQTQSCATCHQQERAFADKRGRGIGSTGQVHPRGPMSLVNVAYSPILTWANPNMRTLEKQALVPMFGDDPVELGMVGQEATLFARLKAERRYQALFATAFPGPADPVTLPNITKAIASFERTILSGDSPYDIYRRGDDANAISPSSKRGEALFFSEALECFHCHGGVNFTGSVDYYGKGFAEVEFHNTGLYNLPGKFSYPEPNRGLNIFTDAPDDVGKFKAPTLRNIAVTAPYMHDGTVKTLGDAIDHYKAGGRRIASGPRAGDGAQNPNKSEFVKGFPLSPQEKEDLLAFLRSLTDQTLLTNPELSDPWKSAGTAAVRHFTLEGEIVRIYPAEGLLTLTHSAIPGLMAATTAPDTMDFRIQDHALLTTLAEGQTISAAVRRKGTDYLLYDLRTLRKPQKH